MRKVNTFIVGAPKSGTTALACYLSDHPQVCVSKPKEPHFFATDLEAYRSVDNESDYHELFSQNYNSSCLIDASVWYLYSDEALENIRKYNPNAKIIVMLRNPSEMVYSMHSQHRYSLDEPIEDFEEAWCVGRADGLNRQQGKFTRSVKTLMYHEIALYGKQITRLYSLFPTEQVHIIFFSDFIHKTRDVYDSVLNFLNLEYQEDVLFEVVNPNTTHKNKTLANFIKSPPVIFRYINRFFKSMNINLIFLSKLLRTINTDVKKRDALSDKLKYEIRDNYREDIELLEVLLNRNLSDWK